MLESLPSIARLSDRVIRVLGQNPGKFTLQGTNTYLVGSKAPFILVDAGEGKDAYIPLLEEAISTAEVGSESIVSDIVITHRHPDHFGGLPSVLQLLHRLGTKSSSERYIAPRVHAFPTPNPSHEEQLSQVLSQITPGTFQPTPDGAVFHPLVDRQILSSPSTSVLSIHTPGHTPDSMCLYLAEDRAIFTGDTILGEGTSVFTDLKAYMDSLRWLSEFIRPFHDYDDQGALPPGGAKLVKLYPAHGPVVDDGKKVIDTYIQHRLEREEQIVDLLRSTAPEGGWTVMAIVKSIYTNYPPEVWRAAAYGVNLHLVKLETEKRVTKHGDGESATWEFLR